MRADYQTAELRRLLAELQSRDEMLGAAIRRNLCFGANWDDKTGRELTDNICAAAEAILREQTGHLVRQPGIFEIEASLSDAFYAFEETAAMLGGQR